MAGFTHCYPLSNQAHWVVGHHAQRWVLRVQQQARVRFMVLALQTGGGLTRSRRETEVEGSLSVWDGRAAGCHRRVVPRKSLGRSLDP